MKARTLSAPEVRTYAMDWIDRQWQRMSITGRYTLVTVWYNPKALNALRRSITFANRIPARKFYAES